MSQSGQLANLIAVDAETGDPRWTFAIPTGGSIDSSPTAANGTVFIGSSRDNNLYAVDTETGRQEWAFETGDSVRSSPTVADGTVFVGSWDDNLYALDAETGQQEWDFETGGGIRSSPTVADGTVFVGNTNGIYAVDAATGNEEWIFETNEFVDSSPIVVNGTVFFGHRGGNLYAVDAGIRGSSEGTRAKLGTLGHHDGLEYATIGADLTGTLPSIGVSPLTTMIAGGGTIGAGVYAWRRLRQSGDDTPSGSSTTDIDTIAHSMSDSATKDTTVDVDQLREQATDALTRGEEAEANDQYQQAAEAYEEAISHLEQAVGMANYVRRKELKTEIDKIEISLDAVTAVDEQGESVATANTDTDEDTKPTPDSPVEDATDNGDQLQERATDAITRGEQAESNGQYQQAVDAYEEAISYLEQAVATTDNDTKTELESELAETRASLETVTATRDQRESIATTLHAAERNFKEAIVRYVDGSQTVARIRFRQARDGFEEAQQAIAENDTVVLAHPITVNFEEEATLPSMALEDLTMVNESTVETLAAVDVKLIDNLECKIDELTPSVVTDLQQSDKIDAEEATLLTILSWWYEGDNREFASEESISRRYDQADYGFEQST